MDLDLSASSEDSSSLVFSVRGPIPIHLDEHGSASSSSSLWSSGASVLDLVFPQPESVSEIRFRNWYTARLTLLVRFDDSVQAAPKREHLAWAAAASLSLARLRGVDSTEGIKIGRNLANSKSLADWVVSVQNKQLMPDPHSELGSQDLVAVASSESLVPLHDITALRFLLRQPSPNWKSFSIEELAVHRHPVVPKPFMFTSGLAVGGGGTSSSAFGKGHLSRYSSLSTPQETSLEVLARQTRDALTGKKSAPPGAASGSSADRMASSGSAGGEKGTSASGASDDKADEDEQAGGGGGGGMPTTYDIMSLQLN